MRKKVAMIPFQMLVIAFLILSKFLEIWIMEGNIKASVLSIMNFSYRNEYASPEAEEIGAKSEKQLLREQKKKRKEKKLKKKAKFEKECFHEKMNCFTHDSQHWRTPPFWTGL